MTSQTPDPAKSLPVVQNPARCGDCQEPLDHPLICTHCHHVAAFPIGLSHFDLLGFPENFDLDEGLVTERYLELMRKINPDSGMPPGNEQQRHLAQKVLIQVNDAYRVLSDAVTRGEYLLSRMGGADMPSDKRMPEGFWEDLNQLTADYEGENEPSKEQRQVFLDQLEERKQLLLAALSKAFRPFSEVHPGTTPFPASEVHLALLEEIRASLNALNYLSALTDRHRRVGAHHP